MCTNSRGQRCDGEIGEGQKISHNFFIFAYLAEMLRHGIATACQIVGDFFRFFEDIQKYLSNSAQGPLKRGIKSIYYDIL